MQVESVRVSRFSLFDLKQNIFLTDVLLIFQEDGEIGGYEKNDSDCHFFLFTLA